MTGVNVRLTEAQKKEKRRIQMKRIEVQVIGVQQTQ